MSEEGGIDIDYLANLARIELTAEEKDRFSRQLEAVLKYFETLKGLDVTDVEPTAHAMPIYNVWGEDEPETGFTVEEALRNAPLSREGQFVVPKVVDDS